MKKEVSSYLNVIYIDSKIRVLLSKDINKIGLEIKKGPNLSVSYIEYNKQKKIVIFNEFFIPYTSELNYPLSVPRTDLCRRNITYKRIRDFKHFYKFIKDKIKS